MTLVGSTSLETEGSDAIGVSGILVIKGGLGASKVVLDLRCILATLRV